MEVQKKMKKSEKKLSKTEREELQFLIEGFLEKDNLEIFESFRDKPDLIAQSWDQLEATLFKDRHWLDEVDPEELAGVDLQKLTLDYHSILKPIWEKLKSAKFDYQDRVLSLRKDASALMKATDTSPLLSEYRELIQQGSIIHSEQFYEIKLTISFDPGHLTFYKRSINVLLNFVDFLGSVPFDLMTLHHIDQLPAAEDGHGWRRGWVSDKILSRFLCGFQVLSGEDCRE